MHHPNYDQWSAEEQEWYNNISGKIKKHGHTILGTVDGKGNLKRPFAYTLGASFTTGSEFLSFFPIKGKGISVISGIMNRIIRLVKDGDLNLSSQILNDDRVYNLPIAMVVLDNEIKEMIEFTWPQQLQRDAFLAEFSTDDHQLISLIASDKDGNLPWEPECGSFWPDMSPPPLVATAQEILTGDDSLMQRLENKLGINERISAEEPADDNEKEEENGREVFKKILNDISDKHPDQKIGVLSANGQKHIEQEEYEQTINVFTELIDLFGWESLSEEDQIIFQAGNLIWSKQGNDRMFPLFWAYYFRGIAKYELEQHSESISDYSTAIDIGLDIIKYDSDGEFTAASARSWTIYAYSGSGLVKRHADNYQDALDDFGEALGLCQDDDVHHKKQIYYNMGLTKKDMGDDEGAVKAFTSSIELDKKDIDSYYWRALSKYGIGEHDSALSDLNYVIDSIDGYDQSLDFSVKRAFYLRGIIRFIIGDHSGAIEDYSKAIEIATNWPNAYYARGITKLAMADPEGAVDDCTEAIKKGYKDSEVYKARGEAKENMGDTKGAKEDFEKYEQLKGS